MGLEMNSTEFFVKQLDATMEIIEHCFDLLPYDRIGLSPPHFNHPAVKDKTELMNYLGEWSAIHVLIHLVVYEELAVIPEMEKFVLDKESIVDWAFVEKKETQELKSNPDLSELLKRFRIVRTRQVDLLKKIDNEILNETKKGTLWGNSYLSNIVNKTIQHTISHGSKLYQKTMYWDAIWNSLEEELKS